MIQQFHSKILPRKLKTLVHTKTSMWMFRAALFTIAKARKPPENSSAGEWVNMVCLSIWWGTVQWWIVYWYMLQHGWASETSCYVKEAQRLPVVWFHLRGMFKEGKFTETEQIHDCPGLRIGLVYIKWDKGNF